MKNSRIIIGVFILILLVAGIGVAAVLFIGSEDSDESSDQPSAGDEQIDNNQEENTGETSRINDDEEMMSDSYMVGLTDLSISLDVPNEIEETSQPSIYKKHQNPDECSYIGQGSDDELLITVSSTSADCLIIDEFDENGTREISSPNGNTYNAQQYSKVGRKGDVLLLETVDVSSDVTFSFFYKELFFDNVAADIDYILQNFELE